MKIAFSDGPVSNTTLTNHDLSFHELADILRARAIDQKDGSYFVRGAGNEAANTRRDENIEAAELAIIDADDSVDTDVVGAPPPREVHEALKSLGVQHTIYTSHSHGTSKGNRYRIVVPCTMQSPVELRAAVDYLLLFLEISGILIKAVDENYRWSQPWYLPRIANETSPFEFYSYPEGRPLDAIKCLQFYESAVISEAESGPHNPDPHSPFTKFNRDNGNPDYMLKLLEENGYLRKYESQHNGSTSYRLLSPTSTSGTPGVILYRSKQGPYRLASYHGDSDPLSKTNPESGKPVSLSAFDLYCRFNHEGNEGEAIDQWLEANDDRPTIDIVQGRISENLEAAIDALASMDPPTVFQRGQMLVRVGHVKEAKDKCKMPKDSACIIPVEKAGLMAKLDQAAKWQKFSRDEWHVSDPCTKVNAALLESAGDWRDIPSLTGISEVPLIKPDGTVLTSAGYDPDSQIYIEGRFPELDIPDHPTKDDALRAVEILLEPFSEFPYVDYLDISVLLAYMLTLVLRYEFTTAPLFCVSSTTPGTGKGLLVECSNLLVRGRDAATMPPITGMGKEEEIRKRITSLLSMGATSINIDNCTQPIGGESLNTLLTAPEWTDRRLGHTEMVKFPTRATWAATGNNLTVKGDMTRRCLLLQLDAGVENPETRRFNNPDLVQKITQNRGLYLSALLTIIKAYRQGPNEDIEILGRFEDWSRAVCAPIVWLGYPNPVLSQNRLKEEDPETDELFGILQLIHSIKQDACFTCAELIEELSSPPTPSFGSDCGTNSEHHLDRNDLLIALKNVAGEDKAHLNSKRLGRYFTRFKGRPVSGHVLHTKPQSPNTKSAKQYYVEKNE